MSIKKQAFTLVELIVVITILAILGTIAFISLQGYSASSRDSVRISDVSKMKTSLELYYINSGKYPLPDNYEIVSYSGDTLWYQGIFGETVKQILSNNLSEVPKDPLSNTEYVFSTSRTKNEFEILNLLEGDVALNTISKTNAVDTIRIPRLAGQYNGLFIKTPNYIVPTPSIITSEKLSGTLILDNTNIKSQIIDGGNNLPAIGSVKQKTGTLDIALSVYSGPTITFNSSESDKQAVMTALKTAYSGSLLASTGIYKTILETITREAIITFVDTVVLNTPTVATPVVITNADCTAGTINGYNYGILTHTQTGAVSKTTGTGIDIDPYVLNSAIATCDNGKVTIDKETTDLYSSCNTIIRNKSIQLNKDGIYIIDPSSNGTGFKVYCDMTTDGGGWTILTNNNNVDSEELGCYPRVTTVDSEVCGNLSLIETNDFTIDASNILFDNMVWAIYNNDFNNILTYQYFKWNSSKIIPESSGVWQINADLFNQSLNSYPTLGNLVCNYGTFTKLEVIYRSIGSSSSYMNGKYFTNFSADLLDGSPGKMSFTDAMSATYGQTKGLDDWQDGRGCGDAWTPIVYKGYSSYVMIK